jgi:hypothetical protein
VIGIPWGIVVICLVMATLNLHRSRDMKGGDIWPWVFTALLWTLPAVYMLGLLTGTAVPR